MKGYGTVWWITARHWAEISALSPLVMSERLLSAALAGGRPDASQQADMTRMVLEKGEAVAESAAALWLATVESQNLAWRRAWRAGRAAPLPEDYALSTRSARKLAGAWSPVSRRVSANAKRLAARKRKMR